jgi:glycosyltransferase involved in cell wall biosynthesis
MTKLSVCIPSRNELYLQRTIDEVLNKAAGDVEVIVVLDGAPPVEPLREDSRVRVIYNEIAKGIGWASWDAAQIATGEYLMKLDAHCLLAEGYDEVLKAECAPDWLLVPSRYQLKEEGWNCGYGPIEYLYMTYPWLEEPQFGGGFHGKKWLGENGLEGHYFFRENRDKGILIDDMMAFQGSMFFMHRANFLRLGGVDRRYWLTQEAPSIGMKVWESGGRCAICKKTWYAHLHKGQAHGRGYPMSKRQQIGDNYYSADYWMHDRWHSRKFKRGIYWWVDHFWPIPGWPEDWDDPKYEKAFLYPGRE